MRRPLGQPLSHARATSCASARFRRVFALETTCEYAAVTSWANDSHRHPCTPIDSPQVATSARRAADPREAEAAPRPARSSATSRPANPTPRKPTPSLLRLRRSRGEEGERRGGPRHTHTYSMNSITRRHGDSDALCAPRSRALTCAWAARRAPVPSPRTMAR